VIYSSRIEALARFVHLFTIQYKHVYTIYAVIIILLSSLHSLSLSASHSPHQPLSTATLSLGKHHYWLRPSRRSSLLINIFPASLSSLAAAVPTLPYGTLQGSYVLNNFLERLSGRRLYERLHDVLLDTGALHALRVVNADWPATPPAPQVGTTHRTVGIFGQTVSIPPLCRRVQRINLT